ncbi:MAG: hypothetical protein EXS14_10200 [Planctomycetes bacterium]|nr:hypothetical protein [Planctomycetota bacterium]
MRIPTLLLLCSMLLAQSKNETSAYTGGLEFVEGWKAGMAEAHFTGRPAMLFFIKHGDDKCKTWSDSAFKDDVCRKTLENFVLVLIDGETEPEARKKYPFKNYPFVKFVDANGLRLCEIWESANATTFEMAAGRALGKHGQIRFTPTYAREVIAADKLETALPLKEFREVIRCSAEIEKINHEGKLLVRARAARVELQAEARKRIDTVNNEQQTSAANKVVLLNAVAREFEGLPEAAEAKALARKITP